MTFSYKQITVKSENDRGFIYCQVEIENGFLTFQKRGLVAGTAGGLVGLVASEYARKTNEVVRIPLSAITSVETKGTRFTFHVTIRAAGFPAYTFGCSSKKDMEKIAALLRGNNVPGRYPNPTPSPVQPKAEAKPMENTADPEATTPSRNIQAQPKASSVLLVMLAGPMTGARFRCWEGKPVVIGRDPARCNLVVNGYSTVSGQHCRIDVSSYGLTATDLNSSNGTFVGGVRLTPGQPASVSNGAELRLANMDCIFRVCYEK